jgi:hypothetical protein
MDKEEKQEQLIRDYAETFGSIQGQRVLRDLEVQSGYRLYSKLPEGKDGHVDVNKVIFQEGQKRIMARIEIMLKKGNPDA